MIVDVVFKKKSVCAYLYDNACIQVCWSRTYYIVTISTSTFVGIYGKLYE